MNLVLVGYTATKTRAALRFCDTALKGLSIRHRVLVCNREGLIDGRGPDGWTVIDGSNAFAEFSGWQEGLDHLLRSGSRESVLFVNDTVNTHRRFSIFRRRALVHELARAPARSIVGFVDHPDNDLGDLTIDGLPLAGWVSSYCFLLGEESLQRLEHLLFDLDRVQRCVPGGAQVGSFFSSCLSGDLRQHLAHWLFSGGWYRSEPLSEANQAIFTAKARVICAELLLSARCWNRGVQRIDPLERHPGLRAADRRSERLLQIFRPRPPSQPAS